MRDSLVVEERVTGGLISLAGDIAQQLRVEQGKVVVACEQPTVLLSLVRKRWLRITRQLMRERAGTVDAAKVLRLTQEVGWMQGRRFSSKASPEALEYFEADVVFARVEELLRFVPECRVMFVTCPIERERLYMITAWMNRNGRVVIYRLKD